MNTISKSTISNESIEVSKNFKATEEYNNSELHKKYFNKIVKVIENMEAEAEVIKQVEIDGYSDYYISNMGRVFSKKR